MMNIYRYMFIAIRDSNASTPCTEFEKFHDDLHSDYYGNTNSKNLPRTLNLTSSIKNLP